MIPRKVSKMLAMVHKALLFWLQNTCDLIFYPPATLGSFLFFNKPCLFLLPGLCLMLLLPGSLVPQVLTWFTISLSSRLLLKPHLIERLLLTPSSKKAWFAFLSLVLLSLSSWVLLPGNILLEKTHSFVCCFSLLLFTNLAKLHESRDSVLFEEMLVLGIYLMKK